MYNNINLTEERAKTIRKELRFSGIFPGGGKFERNIPLVSSFLHEAEKDYMKKPLSTDLSGEEVGLLENEIANYMGKKYATALASGSAAIKLALQLAAGRGYGKRVFCSDFAPETLANSVLQEGFELVFVDVSYDDWCMEPEILEQAFAAYPDVKLVLMNHAYGFPGRAVEIKHICEANDALLIEDASESFGAACFSAKTGAIGDYGILDFGPDRIITGDGGGMLLTNEETLCRSKMQCEMTDRTAALIRAQLKHLEERIDKKRVIYERYLDAFQADGLVNMPVAEEGQVPNYWISCGVCDSGIQFREERTETGYTYTDQHGTASPMEVCDALHAFGAEAYPVYKPLSMQPMYQDCDLITAEGSQKASHGEIDSAGREVFKTAICLPCDIHMTREEQDTIIEIIRACFNEKNFNREDWMTGMEKIS